MKSKNIIKSLAFVSLLVGGVAVANTYIDKFVKALLYRSKKDVLPYDDLMKQYGARDVFIDSDSNFKLHGILIETKGANTTVMMCHPFGHEASEMSMYIPYFKKKLHKTNILLVDARAHGNSDGYIRGLGIKDINDIVSWNIFLLKMYGKKHSILMYGKEFGANSILNASCKGMLQNVKAIISDGAYTSPSDILSYRLKKDYNITKVGSIQLLKNKILKEIKVDIGYSTVSAVKLNQVPTLYFHSRLDEFVPIEHVYPLYNANGGVKELFVTKDEVYLCHVSDTDEYKEILSNFLDKYI